MGRRGPAPKPVSLKVLAGNPGNRPLPETRSMTVSKARCPTWLSPGAKSEWRRIAPELERMGLLTALDRAAFAAYCESYAQWVACTRFLHEHGSHYLTPKSQLREWPQVEMAKQAGQTMRAFAGEFGLTPTSRLRLNIEGPEQEEDEFEAFLSRRG